MTAGADRVIEAARALQSAMQATQSVRLRHRLPNSPQALAILLRLERGQRLSPRHLQDIAGKPTYALDGLRGAGLIEDAAPPADRRTSPLRLTERGAAVADELRRALGEWAGA